MLLKYLTIMVISFKTWDQSPPLAADTKEIMHNKYTYILDNSLDVDMFSMQVLIIGYDISQGVEVITRLIDRYVWNMVKLACIPATEQVHRWMRLTDM